MNKHNNSNYRNIVAALAIGASMMAVDQAIAREALTYRHDDNGNVMRREHQTGSADYVPDPLNRLSSQSAPSVRGWTYDDNGNRRTQSGQQAETYEYPPRSNRLTDVGGQTVTTDDAGNITDVGNRRYVYNNAGQISEVYDGTTLLARYTYNHRGLRTRKVAGSVTTLYHYDPDGKLISETTSAGVAQREYVYREDRPFAQVTVSGATETLVYLHTDSIGTPYAATNSQGTTVWRSLGNAFGDSAPLQDVDVNGQSTVINLRFPGQYFDSESGLHYNWMRYYDPRLGRYVTSDPIGLAGGMDTYSYAYNNPLRYIDPYGLWAWGDPLPQGLVDFSAGMGDVILFGQGQRLRDLVGVDGGVDKCSVEYGAGEWAGFGVSLATGVYGGIRAAGARGAGIEFSHAIPARWGGPRTILNGNYVPTAQHALSDPYRYRFMSRAWKAENPFPNWFSRMWNRTPNTWLGAPAGAAYGGAGMALSGP